ncbi:hypothetical protein B1F79_00125 [Coxiella-like endosymbiont of Rhipicephalus sanguineus]|nr:hypothetical protein [Coxiella-like endosymbiont of Rhipicephalus sanguineus]
MSSRFPLTQGGGTYALLHVFKEAILSMVPHISQIVTPVIAVFGFIPVPAQAWLSKYFMRPGTKVIVLP